jgi:hypothetical protein
VAKKHRVVGVDEGLQVVVGGEPCFTLKFFGNEGFKVMDKSQVQALRVDLAR